MDVYYTLFEPHSYSCKHRLLDYAQLITASANSIRHYSSDHRLSILTIADGLRAATKRVMRKLDIDVVYVNEEWNQRVQKLYGTWLGERFQDLTIGAYLRFFLLTEMDEFLYLDPDTIVFDDLAGLKILARHSVYIRYVPRPDGGIQLNSGVIFQREPWLKKGELDEYLRVHGSKRHRMFDQGILEQMLEERMPGNRRLLGLLPVEYNYRDYRRSRFHRPVAHAAVEDGVLVPYGKCDDGKAYRISVYHYGADTAAEFEGNRFASQFCEQ